MPHRDQAPGAVFPDLTPLQAAGHICIVCRTQLTQVHGYPPIPESVVVGTSAETGRPVRACTAGCAPMVGYVPPARDEQLPLM